MPIKIKSKKKDFRRCGIAHPTEFVEYSDDRFSKEELAALKAEPILIVETVKGKTPAPPAGGKTAAGEETGKKDGEDINLLTVAQLLEEIGKFQPVDLLKKTKKADLIEILKTHMEAAAAAEE